MNPRAFSPRAVLVLVLLGVGLFAALLWQIGGGVAASRTDNGGAHAGGTGLNGFAGLNRLLQGEGYAVTLGRSEADWHTAGVLVLTPEAYADGEKLTKAVTEHRRVGPVVVIAPKWQTLTADTRQPGQRQGWVRINGTELPHWKGFLDDVAVDTRGFGHGARRVATSLKVPAPVLPDAMTVEVGQGERLLPFADAQGHVLAARYDETIPLSTDDEDEGEAKQAHPLFLVFEPDLLDNYGLSHADNAIWAADFFHRIGQPQGRVTFDVTFNGLGRAPNLLTLAFMPPYLAATLVLGLAVVAAMWRALLRFGPTLDEGRAIALGKASLLGNAAALMRRARRFHVLGAPYADASRARLARALSLPRQMKAEAVDAAIDRALAARRASGLAVPDQTFTSAAAQLARAQGEGEILALARTLHAIERIVIA
ncbi:hypothetical protein [Novosphingobium rosa]|uniref:hypothetical protein n=1 Tax=Novosphingobium rosa TaxID=76978 RepID=UPI000832592F|nr:hypothetical protein [Novosphingobium rosa]